MKIALRGYFEHGWAVLAPNQNKVPNEYQYQMESNYEPKIESRCCRKHMIAIEFELIVFEDSSFLEC